MKLFQIPGAPGRMSPAELILTGITCVVVNVLFWSAVLDVIDVVFRY
jgi:hypothetical protein